MHSYVGEPWTADHLVTWLTRRTLQQPYTIEDCADLFSMKLNTKLSLTFFGNHSSEYYHIFERASRLNSNWVFYLASDECAVHFEADPDSIVAFRSFGKRLIFGKEPGLADLMRWMDDVSEPALVFYTDKFIDDWSRKGSTRLILFSDDPMLETHDYFKAYEDAAMKSEGNSTVKFRVSSQLYGKGKQLAELLNIRK